MDLLELLRPIWRYKWVISAFICLITLAGFWRAKSAPPVYEATAMVMIKKFSSGTTPYPLYGGAKPIDFVEIFKSPPVVQAALRRLSKSSDPLSPARFRLQGELFVQQLPGTSFLHIRYRSTTAVDAVRTLEMLIESVDEYSRALQQNESRALIAAIGEELTRQESLHATLVEMERKAASVREEARVRNEIARIEDVIVMLQQRTTDLKVIFAVQKGEVEIIQPPLSTNGPAARRMSFIVALSLFWGAVVGVGLTYFLDSLRNHRKANAGGRP